MKLGKKWYLSLNRALEISNNQYFEELGRKLGLERMQTYAQTFGFGERAGIGIEFEPAGGFPEKAPSPRQGGVGKIASFGQGISMTVFQLAAFVSAVANGGTLYYLQYPGQAGPFVPRIKRVLPFQDSLATVREGMEKAVLTGTARRARQPGIQMAGKTGTCSQNRDRLGWFAGYSDRPGKLAIVVLLRTGVKLGGGPRASEIAWKVFRKLSDQDYFRTLQAQRKTDNAGLVATVQLEKLP